MHMLQYAFDYVSAFCYIGVLHCLQICVCYIMLVIT